MDLNGKCSVGLGKEDAEEPLRSHVLNASKVILHVSGLLVMGDHCGREK